LLRHLTGFPIIKLNNLNEINPDSLFNQIEEYCKNRYIIFVKAKKNVNRKNYPKMSLSNSEDNSKEIFHEDTYYPVIDVIRDGNYKVIVVRNIWTEKEFKGDYFYNHLSYPLRVLDLFNKFTDMSVNFLTIQEFTNNFDKVILCMNNQYSEQSFRGKFVRAQVIINQ